MFDDDTSGSFNAATKDGGALLIPSHCSQAMDAANHATYRELLLALRSISKPQTVLAA
jgi:hypothetical protein